MKTWIFSLETWDSILTVINLERFDRAAPVEGKPDVGDDRRWIVGSKYLSKRAFALACAKYTK